MAEPSPAPTGSRYLEFDGLRFFAVVGVMAVHFSPGNLAKLGPWGDWGVRFFFVLSGFLITRLLLDARRRVIADQTNRVREYLVFSLRRTLRLWPIYFLVVLGTAAANLDFAREMLPWNFAFAGNHYIYNTQIWPKLLSHLWTLAVEQQFYLLWPLVMLLASPGWRRRIIFGLILAGPVFRAMEASFAGIGTASFILLPACVDYFAWGALLADNRSSSTPSFNWIGRPGMLALFLGAVCIIGFHLRPEGLAWPVLASTLLAAAAAATLTHCLSHKDSWFKRTCRLGAFVYLGRISYGIYLYHNLTHWIGPGLLHRVAGKRYFESEFIHLLYYATLSVLFAIVSWHLLEFPLERIRHRIFPSKRHA